MTAFLAVVGSVTPPGRLNAAIATAVEMAAARPACQRRLNLADHRVSFADGPRPEVDDDTGTVIAQWRRRLRAAGQPGLRGTFTGALRVCST